jgi:hypothetical protein
MKLKLAVLVIFCAVAISADAQAMPSANAFTFNASSNIISWNGSDPANPPYPLDMGKVSLDTQFGGGWGASISVPWQLGYLNHGELNDCLKITNWGPRVFTKGDGTHAGDTFTETGSTTCPYFNSNNLQDGFGVVASYIVKQNKSCGNGRCIYYFTYPLTGGTGTVTETVL